MPEILPVIVADLAEERAHGALLQVARENGNAWVPLITAPVDTRLHLLEVYTPGVSEPLRLLARPLGPPSEKGFPLALSIREDDGRQTERPPPPPMDHDTIGQSRPPVRLEDDEEEERGTPPTPPNERMPLPPPRVPKISAPTTRLDTPTSVRRIPVAAPVEPKLSDRHRADLAGVTPPPPSPTALQDKLIGRQLAGGKVEIESLIGTGSNGSVYRARHRELRMFVAVKILHESFQHDVEFCRRFYAEALAISRLDHPNLVRLYDFGQEPDGLLYLSMEFLDGTSLRSLLERRGRLAETRIVELMLQVTAGLVHAHGKNLIHRDVRPDNVVVVATHDDEGSLRETVKLLDFGIAVTKSSGDGSSRQGNPIYMSPEQCRAEELDERSDVYACGIMMYELATGKPPFNADKPITIVNRQLSMPAPLIAESRPEIDPRLDTIVQRALKKSKADRYTTMRELRADLKELLQPGMRPASNPPSGPMPASAPISVQPAVSLPPPPMPSVSLPPSPPENVAPSEPPAPAPTPPPPRPSKAPEWLEDRGDSIARFLNGMATGSARTEQLADTLSHDAVAWLKPFVEERDMHAFSQKLTELDRAVRVLAHRGDAKALWAVSSTVHGLATEGTQGPNTRAAKASALLRLFTDPGMLGPVAERLLSTEDDSREAGQTLLVRAKVAGAYALYGARVKLAAHPRVRAPFVATMTAVGEGAWPVVRAALEKIPPAALTGGHPLASELAEDLLLCVPSVRDEAAGHLVATYVRSTVPSLCRAATRALARLWAERARPLLLGLLANEDDGVRIAAIAGLREIGAVDEHAARRIAPFANRGAATHELRVAALQALGSMTIEARPVAVPILAQLVRDPTSPDDASLIAAATALVRTAGPDAHGVIRERAERSSEPIRGQLLALLG